MVIVLSKFHLKSNKFYIGISNSFRLIGIIDRYMDLLIKSSSRVNNMEYYITSRMYHVCMVKYFVEKEDTITTLCVCVLLCGHSFDIIR